ncbi:hypothetical protein [Streptomyces sp. x-80]|uniref:hypothetical protein n=1 Tax=Streptomyces sp. x-80 TaxID=2789282 RepID=UPI00397EB03B
MRVIADLHARLDAVEAENAQLRIEYAEVKQRLAMGLVEPLEAALLGSAVSQAAAAFPTPSLGTSAGRSART